jgi:hypothetical protein
VQDAQQDAALGHVTDEAIDGGLVESVVKDVVSHSPSAHAGGRAARPVRAV